MSDDTRRYPDPLRERDYFPSRDCKHGHLARSCEVCQLERDLAAANARAEQYEAQYVRANAFAEERDSENARLRAEVEEARSHAASLSDALHSRNREVERLKTVEETAARWHDKIISLRAEVERLTGELQELTALEMNHEGACARLTLKLADCHARAGDFAAECERLTRERDEAVTLLRDVVRLTKAHGYDIEQVVGTGCYKRVLARIGRA